MGGQERKGSLRGGKNSLFDKIVVVKVEVVHDKEVRARILTSGERLLVATYGTIIGDVVEEGVKKGKKGEKGVACQGA